jgi:hypothetical protein
MFGGNTHVIRIATLDDDRALRRLAELDSQRPLSGRVLIGEIDGQPAAAISLADERVIADPFQPTSHLVVLLGLRAGALRAHQQTPSLADRVRDALRPRAAHSAT